MNLFDKIADSPELLFWTTAGVVAVSMLLGAFVIYIFGVLPLREQRQSKGRVTKLCDDGIPAQYYKNIISDLQNEVEFWQGNCITAEDRYNKLYASVKDNNYGKKM